MTTTSASVLRPLAHLAVGAILVWVGYAALQSGERTALVAVVIFAVCYLLGLSPVARQHRGLVLLWGAVITGAWLGVALTEPSGPWLALPLLLLAASVVPSPLSVPVVGGLTMATIAALTYHHGWTVLFTVLPIAASLLALTLVYVVQAFDSLSSDRVRALERERQIEHTQTSLAEGMARVEDLLASVETLLEQEPALAAQRIALARRIVTDDLGTLRRLNQDLASPELEAVALPDALDRLAARLGPPTVHFSVEGEPVPVSLEINSALVKVAREALTNAIRHGHVRQLAMMLAFEPHRLKLSIIDDGVGIDEDTGTPAHPAPGLAEMTELTDRIGATLRIDTGPELGTRVHVVVPLG